MQIRRALVVPVTLVALTGAGLGGLASALNNPDTIVPTMNDSDACGAGSLGSADPCQTDNRSLTYFMTGSLPQSARDQVNLVLNQMYDTTVLNVSYESPAVYTGSSETDIVYQQGTVPGSDTGYTWCDDPNGFYTCDQQYIQVESGSWTKGLTCHETGHAVGLVHGQRAFPAVPNNDPSLKCMEKPTPATDNLGDNNKDNINATY
jgi:hypothetical protein